MSKPQIRYETNELRLLFEVSQALEGVTDLYGHLELVLELMARYTGMLHGRLALLDPNAGLQEVSYGFQPSGRKLERYEPGQDISGQVIESGRPMVLAKLAEEPSLFSPGGVPPWSKEELACIGVPIFLDGKPVGALSADRLFADSVRPEEDARLLLVLAELIARAVKSRLDFQTMHSALVEENRRLQQLVRGRFHTGEMVAASAAMRSIMEELALVANSGVTVLLRGESGSGKERAASLIHANSPRSGRPFIKFNCAGLPEELLERELFGCAQSGRKGRFEMAHGGTLFLDEVGELSLPVQAKLLRAVQEREFERVGSAEILRADVRLIAASGCNLEVMLDEGRFRLDLYQRLTVFSIFLPPLRERRDEIMVLVRHFLEQSAQANGRKIARISAAAVNMLLNYSWPGNVRELENVLERAVILSGAEGVIDAHHLPAAMRDSEEKRLQGYVALGGKLDETLEQVEKRLLADALQSAGGNMAKAARHLGVTERIMGLRMKKYGLDYKAFRKLDAPGDN